MHADVVIKRNDTCFLMRLQAGQAQQLMSELASAHQRIAELEAGTSIGTSVLAERLRTQEADLRNTQQTADLYYRWYIKAAEHDRTCFWVFRLS